jgi:hypothetical protein
MKSPTKHSLLPAASQAPFKKTLVAVSHALLACSLLAACDFGGDSAGPESPAADGAPVTSDEWQSQAADLSNPTIQEFALLKASCMNPGLPLADQTATPPAVSEDPAALSPAAALAARLGVPQSSVYLNSDLEAEDKACWDHRLSGFNRVGCGLFKGIGSYPVSLSAAGPARSGSKAIRITYAKNEELGGTNVGVDADTVNVRSYFYFDQGFDFGQGVKIGRVSSFNPVTQMNDIDVILVVRSADGANQCGVTDMRDIGIYFNGKPTGHDWGNASANVSFERGRWYAVEYQVILNTPGSADGSVRLWVDGAKVAEKTGLRVRGNFGSTVKLNTVRVGGWYSNSARGNPCPSPDRPSTLYMDDVAIAKSYIGTL